MKNLHKLHKRAILFICLFLGVIISCDRDLLEQTNPNSITPDVFWKTPDDAEKGLIGVYSPLTGVRYYGRMYVFTSDYRDDLINGFNKSDRTAAGRFDATSDTPAVLFVWEEMWKVVSRANTLLFRVPEISFEDQDEKKSILGEGLFLRSLAYFDLVNIWRNIPLIVTPLTIQETSGVTQAPPEEVYVQIIEDLEAARTMLPTTRDETGKGRITWGAATALLGKVYLYTGNFSKARDMFKEIIDSNLYSLVDKYQDNFSSLTENNSESIFELQMDNNGNRGWAGDRAGTGRANSVVPDFAPPGFTNQNGMRINQWALDLFLDEQTINGEIDPRAFITLFWNTNETTTYKGDVLSSKTYEDKTYAEAISATDTRIFGNKYVLSDAEEGNINSNFHQASSNWRIIRYADVLLMYAEAEMEVSGSTTQAVVDAVNLIRTRADMPDFDLTMTMQDIRDERVKELSLEHTRYFDLLRWGLVKARIVDTPDIKSESGGVAAYQPGREYIDIPQRDLDANPNLKHNPGY